MKENLENYGLVDSNRSKVEAWFDEHAMPEEINCHWFTESFTQVKDIKVYFCEHQFDDWMIKITCANAQKSLWLSKVLSKTTRQMGIEQILIFKELFLLRRRSSQDLRLKE